MTTSHRVTTFELFFDLVYVFALTQVTAFMAHAHSGTGVLRGVLLLALLWWSWSAYAWLGNQARADLGMLRAGMGLAMAGVFVVALAVPEAWHDAPGGLNGPLVLAGAYLFVRCVHLVVYGLLARGGRELVRQVVVSWPPVLAGAGLLLAGAAIGGGVQTVLFTAAIALDWGVVYATSRRGGWRIHSAPYFAERYELFVIIALGESLTALGVGAAELPVSLSLLAAAALGVGAAMALWWLYFDVVTLVARRRLHQAGSEDRLALAAGAYGVGHFPVVAGIVLTALGVEGVVGHAGSGHGLGWFSAGALCGGAALYLGGLLLFGRLAVNVWGPFRLVALVVVAAWTPAAAALPPLAALAGVVVVLAVLAAVETWWFAELRHRVRA
ncbi:low temperature requirement protein A [Streptomyces diastatochromogenes]|uniref:Low temperature requirement protein A n=1 Tax=Streptomyces diastatochromogenes TaxID=42236 RepID=A0A233SBH5_STRDA|nr:low temperature requirement protein A [Streptomyces diastatochromogenes]